MNNSSYLCDGATAEIDALPQPINALVGGMLSAGVHPADIWLYEASRQIHSRFRLGLAHSGTHLLDAGCGEVASFVSPDPQASVTFQHSSLTPRRIADVVVNATYLINMPILKDHGIAGVTLGFKNHFGTINDVVRMGADDLHLYIRPGDAAHYRSSYNPMLDIYLNPHIRNKTVLVIGDALFGAHGGATNDTPPAPWASFGDQAPNSLFFATDPVAIDCVMLDILDLEPSYHPQRPGAEDYLQLASNAGLGVFERRAGASGYTLIERLPIEL
jgi:hypothetical protein